MIRRWLPHPLLSALLLLIWLLFGQSLSPGSILLGALLGMGLGRLFALLQPPRVRLRHAHLFVGLFARVMLDIVRSNLAVARIVLRRERRMHSGFVSVPLQLDDRHGLVVLACIITSTPGTIWVSHDPDTKRLLIHVLDLVDPQSWIDTIKQRYERPLLEIFR